MKMAGFPAFSPWAHRRLLPDDIREITAAEPVAARVIAFVDPTGVFVTVRILDGARRGEGTARNTIEAFRRAQTDFLMQPVVSLLSGDVA